MCSSELPQAQRNRYDKFAYLFLLIFEPLHVTANNLDFRPGTTQTGLYNHRGSLYINLRRTEIALTKTLISCAVTASSKNIEFFHY